LSNLIEAQAQIRVFDHTPSQPSPLFSDRVFANTQNLNNSAPARAADAAGHNAAYRLFSFFPPRLISIV
jgi:hypothetical protein